MNPETRPLPDLLEIESSRIEDHIKSGRYRLITRKNFPLLAVPDLVLARIESTSTLLRKLTWLARTDEASRSHLSGLINQVYLDRNQALEVMSRLLPEDSAQHNGFVYFAADEAAALNFALEYGLPAELPRIPGWSALLPSSQNDLLQRATRRQCDLRQQQSRGNLGLLRDRDHNQPNSVK